MSEHGIIIGHGHTGLICKCKADIRFKPNKSYVYAVLYKSEIVYIGKGNKSRWKHSNNGKSHNTNLNELFYQGEIVDVFIFRDGLSDGEALRWEAELIEEISPAFNSTKVNLEPTICRMCGEPISNKNTVGQLQIIEADILSICGTCCTLNH